MTIAPATSTWDPVDPSTIPGLKFSTPRNPDLPTLGRRQGAFSRIWLGSPLLPFQQLIADVTGEYDPDTGLPVRSLNVITGPRQIGKSHLAMARNGERCMSVPGFKAWYTAQTGSDARDQFLKFADEVVAGSPLEHVTRTLRGMGAEVMKFGNRSTIRPHPPTEAALHGKQSDSNDIDEAWVFPRDVGKQLLQAIAPTQLTRPGAQTFIWSAGGTTQSTWLAELVARGRAGDPSIGYFEFGIPDDLGLDDMDAIAAHHPAFGHTVSLESIKSLRTSLEDDAEFARAAGNRWTEIIGGAIGGEDWKAVRAIDPIPDTVTVAYGAARSTDGLEVAIAAAAWVDDRIVVEIVDVLPTPYRAAAQVNTITADGSLAVDAVGPSSGLHRELTKQGRDLVPINTGALTAATANIMDGIRARQILFRRHPALDAAVGVAALRSLGDGGVAWARRAATSSIATLEAATLAVWALDNRTIPAGSPIIDFGG